MEEVKRLFLKEVPGDSNAASQILNSNDLKDTSSLWQKGSHLAGPPHANT